MFKKEAIEAMINGTPAERRFICEQDFKYFFAFYFTKHITFKTPEFHFQAFEDLKWQDGLTDLIWMWFREGAKTSIAKAYICYVICHTKKRYILYDSYELDNSERNLYDIAVELQTNKELIADYGQLFFEPKNREEKSSEKKSISEFITVNKVKVEAISTQESVRGRVYDTYRPDLLVADDFENEKTKSSNVITSKIIVHMGEFMAGMAGHATRLYLCNYISDHGSVQRLMEASRSNPSYKLHRVDAETNGQPTWAHKYTMTDIEAEIANLLIVDPSMKKVSLETKKRFLNAHGRAVYEQEMLNQPITAGDHVFDHDMISARLKTDVRTPTEVIGEWKLWSRYNPSHRYALGADTALGVGRDSNAGVIIDFSTNPRATVVATYANNLIPPDLFAYELANLGKKFGECVVCPEISNTGYATVTKLKDIYNNIYAREQSEDYITVTVTPKKLGWDTNAKTKPQMIYDLKSAIEEGLLDIHDENLLRELLSYGVDDISSRGGEDGSTRHFDLVIACAIAWQMNVHAQAKKVVEWREKETFDRFSIM